jgi:hypothetical protein
LPLLAIIQPRVGAYLTYLNASGIIVGWVHVAQCYVALPIVPNLRRLLAQRYILNTPVNISFASVALPFAVGTIAVHSPLKAFLQMFCQSRNVVRPIVWLSAWPKSSAVCVNIVVVLYQRLNAQRCVCHSRVPSCHVVVLQSVHDFPLVRLFISLLLKQRIK